jgi:glycosyltransferase involved in cell wall biosynthesis
MNIVVFTDFFLEVPGGIPTSIMGQKKQLEDLGHRVTVFCPGLKPSRDATVKVVPSFRWIHPGGCPISRRIRVVKRYVRRELKKLGTVDVIHVHHEATTSLAGIQLARELGIPYVQTMHGREDMALTATVWQPFAWILSCLVIWLHSTVINYKLVVKRDQKLARTKTACHMWGLMVNHANNADAVIVPSHHFAQKLQHYGMSKPTYIVSNGVEDEAVEEVDWQVRKWDGKEPLKILWSSRLSRAKRPVEFLQAVALTDFPIRLSVFGDGDQEVLAKLEAKRATLRDKVRFYGSVKPARIVREMAKHHLLVLASYNFDNQPMTMLEALAAGLPVIYCDPDMREIVPADGALMTDGPEPERMAAGLQQLAERPEMIAQMSRVMMQHRREALASTQIRKLLDVYARVQGREL